MVEVTESDTKAAKALARTLFDGDYDPKNIKDTFTNAFATHRIEAAKAERDRLRNLPDDVMVEVMESFNNGLIKKADPTNPRGFVTYYDPLQASRNLVTALAAALEGEHP